MLSLISFATAMSGTLALQRWLDDFDYNTFVGGSDEQYEIYWNANQDSCELEVGLAVATDGWVAFGISANGIGMQNADIILGWVTDENEVVLQNRIGQGFGRPPLFEDQSHFKHIEGWREEVDGVSMTYIRFIKEMFPSHEHSVPVELGTTKVIWAWRDGVLSADATPQPHTHRGIESMNLLQGESAEVDLPDDAESHVVFFPDIHVPSKDTTYYCSLLELPPLNDTHHVVQIDPVITEGNIGEVHHMLLYVCPEHLLNESHIGSGSDCDELHENMPGVLCRGAVLMYAWAVGGKSFYFPDNVGLEIGGDDLSSARYVLLETHYDNPQMKTDVVDSSGLRLWYTPTLREQSALMLGVGMDAHPGGMAMPGGLPSVKTYGYCFADCLSEGLEGVEGQKIYAFANVLHTHTYGISIYLRHIRDGKELRPLDLNKAYDFNYQQTTPFEQVVEILPGDVLIVECEYDTSGTTETIFGGESTSEEMCLSFLYVYPKPDVVFCSTSYVHYVDDNDQITTHFQDFLDDAEVKGFYDPVTGLYDSSMDGAADFYHDFSFGQTVGAAAQRMQTCINGAGRPLEANLQTHPVLRPGIEYEPFSDDEYFVCSLNAESAESNGLSVGEIVGVVIGTVVGVLLIAALIMFLVVRHRKIHSSFQEVATTNTAAN